jgi:hypothetical protein
MAFPFNPKCPSPEEAMVMKEKVIKEGAYYNTDKRFTDEQQAAAVAKVAQLNEVIAGKRKWLD